MNILIFGATGMVGQGVLRECLLSPEVTSVRAVVRSSTGVVHDKFKEIIHGDMFDLSPVASRLGGVDACLFVLGVSSFRMKEDTYTHLTYDLTMSVATVLDRLNPGMRFEYVSGASTDSTEEGKSMWARVKGRTENALLRLFPGRAFMFRPGVIQALNGAKTKTPLYNAAYIVLSPVIGLLRRVYPQTILDTERVGRAMVNVAARGFSKPILETGDIADAAA
jgi:uncharacterized protein YbjT (DUF2867 family)